MEVIERPFFNLAVIKAPLQSLVTHFSAISSLKVKLQATPFIFPNQPYNAGPNDPPMLLWSPACSPELTAFMPHVSSGDYFVVKYASDRFGYSVIELRSTTPEVEWLINEFIAYEGSAQKRIVRAMRDSPRWEFYASGIVLPFEEEGMYRAHQIRDRFTRVALLSYAESWGAPVRTPAFWSTNNVAFTFDSAG